MHKEKLLTIGPLFEDKVQDALRDAGKYFDPIFSLGLIRSLKVGLHARFFMRFGRDDLVAGGCRDKYRTCKQ